MTGQYRYLACNAFTGQILDEIPFTNISFTSTLNKPGTFTGRIGMRHPKCTRANLEPRRTALYIVRDNVILWGGLLWTARVQSTNLEVSGEGIFSYFKQRTIRVQKTYSAWDQLGIVRDLMTYAQGTVGALSCVQLDSTMSGVARDRTYNSWERKNLGEAIEQLAAVDNGFDFNIDYIWSGYPGTPMPVLTLSYPARTRVTDLVFDSYNGIHELSWALDGKRTATVIDEVGAGDSSGALLSSATDTSQYTAGYPETDLTISRKDVTAQATLDAYASADLRKYAANVETMEFQYAGANAVPVGGYTLGDEVSVRVNDGYAQINGRYRIIGYTVTVDESARELAYISCAPSATF